MTGVGLDELGDDSRGFNVADRCAWARAVLFTSEVDAASGLPFLKVLDSVDTSPDFVQLAEHS